jgi:cell division protein FtsW (lipid II flippase)
MKGNKQIKLLLLIFLFGGVGFFNLFLLQGDYGLTPIILYGVIILLMSYSYFIIKRFFVDGDTFIFMISCLLTIIGIIFLYRLDILNLYLHNQDILSKAKAPRDITSYGLKQLIYFAVGITAYLIIIIVLRDFESLRKFRYVYLVLTIIFMGISTFFGREVYGAKNWIYVFGYSFQPSEFGKIFLVLYLASALDKYKYWKDLIEPALIVTASLFFMVLQKDLGSALIFFAISVTMLYIASSKIKYVLTCLALFIFGSILSYKLFYHIRKRIMIWEQPWAYANNESYQIVQSLIALGEGGLFGKGLGFGHPEFVPVNASDFIFVTICEDLGMMMGFAILILFFILFYRCMRAALRAKDNFSRLAAVGYSAMIAAQTLVIVGGVTNAVPLTGITLPLISSGGSSLLITYFALGVIQKISEEGTENGS